MNSKIIKDQDITVNDKEVKAKDQDINVKDKDINDKEVKAKDNDTNVNEYKDKETCDDNQIKDAIKNHKETKDKDARILPKQDKDKEIKEGRDKMVNRKRKDYNNELFENCKKLRRESSEYKNLIQKMKDDGQLPIVHVETTLSKNPKFLCPKDGGELNSNEEGHVCYKCCAIFHQCFTCLTHDDQSSVEWSILTGWQKTRHCKPPRYEVVLTDIFLPPHVPKRNSKTGKAYIDDSTIFHWLCPMCQTRFIVIGFNNFLF